LGFQVHFLLAIDRTLKSSTAKGKQSTTSYASRRIIDCKSNRLPKNILAISLMKLDHRLLFSVASYTCKIAVVYMGQGAACSLQII